MPEQPAPQDPTPTPPEPTAAETPPAQPPPAEPAAAAPVAAAPAADTPTPPAAAPAEPAAPEKLAEVAAFESVSPAATQPTPEAPAESAAASAPEPDSADPPPASTRTISDTAAEIDAMDLEALLKQANFEDASTVTQSPAADAEPLNLPSFQQVMQDAQVSSIDLLRDVELNVKIELGRNRMLVEDVLKLAEGSVVELDKLAGDPVDVFVNERLVARGEVLVLNDNFCVRVNEIVTGVKEEGL